MPARTRRLVVLTIVLVRMIAIGTTPTRAQASDFAPVEPLIEEQMSKFYLPSVVVAVARDGKIVWERAFGWADIERRRRATRETPYYMASVTKSLTATALMTLVERGRVSLDAPVNEYLGAARIQSGTWNPNEATVRRVASHTSGLPNYWRDCPAAERKTCEPSIDRTIQRYGLIPSERIAVALVANSSHGTLFQTVSEATLAALLPPFRRRQGEAAAVPAAASAPPAPAPATVATPGTGTWRGAVRTPDGTLPLILVVAPDGGLTVSLSGQPPLPLTQPRSGALFVRGFLKGALPNDDLPGAPPDMELLLALRDGKLVGTLTMQGVIRDAGFFLPHLVELTREAP